MNKLTQIVTAALMSIVLATSVGFAKVIDGVAAVVDNEVITIRALNEAVGQARHRAQAVGMPINDEKQFRKQILEMLILKKIQMTLAARHEIKASKQEVNEAIVRLRKARGLDDEKFKQALHEENMSMAEFKKSIEEQIILQKLVQAAVARDVKISDQEIKQAQQHMAHVEYDVVDYWLPEESKLKQAEAIKTMHAIKEALQAGHKIDLMAKYPQLKRDVLGKRTLTELPSIFAGKVAKLARGGVTEPIQAGNGVHVLMLKGKRGEISRDEARQRLFMKRLEEKRRLWLQNLRAMTYVKINTIN